MGKVSLEFEGDGISVLKEVDRRILIDYSTEC